MECPSSAFLEGTSLRLCTSGPLSQSVSGPKDGSSDVPSRAWHVAIFLKAAFITDKLFLLLNPEALKIEPNNA